MLSSLLTVTTPATEFALLSLERVQEELDDDELSDDLLTQFIAEESALVANYCNRVFAKEDVVETFRQRHNGYPGNQRRPAVLNLARYPIVAIASVLEGDTALVADTDYEFEAKSGLLYRLCGDQRHHWCATKTVVTYTAGYELPDDAPADLAANCLKLVKARAMSRQRDPALRVEEIRNVLHQEYWVGGIGDRGLPPDVAAALSNYRNIIV